MNTKKLRISTLLLFGLMAMVITSLVFMTGCKTIAYTPKDDAKTTVQELQSVVDANNRFTFDLYTQLAQDDKNTFFSPYSISQAFVFPYEGADGKTASELQKTFYYPDDTTLRDGYARLGNILNGAHEGYTLSTSNNIWVEKTMGLLPAYQSIIGHYYAGTVQEADFKNAPEQMRIQINQRVTSETRGKITDLMPQGSINPSTRVVITNAIYFKGKWEHGFESRNTRNAPFYLAPSNPVDTLMMHQTESFGYYEDDALQAINLPYEGGEISMMIILPKNDLTSITPQLSAETVRAIESQMSSQKVQLSLPKFKFQTAYNDLVPTLETLGVHDAFSTTYADFSKMAREPLYINVVVHKAYIDVNEEGTEAAAATGIGMMTSAAAPSTLKVFTADHPFIFLIQEKSTGEILFMGRVTDPRAQ